MFPNLRTCPTVGTNNKKVATLKQVLPHVCARFVSHDRASHFPLTGEKKKILEMSFQRYIPEFQNLLEGKITFVYNREKVLLYFLE